MIKLLLLCLCLLGVRGSPLQAFDVVDDVANDAEIIEAAQLLPGTSNLLEKRVPVIRLAIPSSYMGLFGTGNLAERVQVPYDYYLPFVQPGVANLEEKALPEAAIREANHLLLRHPNFEEENVDMRF